MRSTYTGFDTFQVSRRRLGQQVGPGRDRLRADLDGGGGVGDQIKLTTGDILVKIGDNLIETVSFNFSKIDINYKQFTDFGLVADKTTPLALEINRCETADMDAAAGAVGAGSKLSSGPGIAMGPRSGSPTRSSCWVINYTGFDTFKYLGDARSTSWTWPGSSSPSSISMAGGGVGDQIKLTTSSISIKIGDDLIETVSLNFSKIDINYKQFTDLRLSGRQDHPAGVEDRPEISPTWTLLLAQSGARSS